MELVCENNPDITNNTHVEDYIRFDEKNKEYLKFSGFLSVATLGASLFMATLSAVALSTNPNIIRTGLFANIVGQVSGPEIIRTIKTISITGGGLSGLASAVTLLNPNESYMKRFSEDKEERKKLKEIKDRDRKFYI